MFGLTTQDIRYHMMYKTAISKDVWAELCGKMYRPMQVGYALISIKANLIIFYCVYHLITCDAMPIYSLTA